MITPSSPIVFIVDDDEDKRLSMQRILKTVDLRAELFARAQDFLQKNIPDVPSCLVLDVRLPGMGGLEVQQKLIEAGINIPIIFITAHCVWTWARASAESRPRGSPGLVLAAN